MMLQELYRLAEREQLMADPDFESKPVAWLIRIGKNGKLLGIEGTHYLPETEGKRTPRPLAKTRSIPRQPGRSGTNAPAYFLVDNAKYVFGVPTQDKPFSEAEGKEKSAKFRERVAACAAETGDEGVRAVLALLEDLSFGRANVQLPETCLSNEQFAFIYTPDIDLCVHQRPTVREYWKRQRQPVRGAGDSRQCLISGEAIGEVGLFPLLKGVPGGTSSGAALVSFNKPAFESYGWDGNGNAPISRDAAEACATALQRLLHPAFPHPLHPNDTLPRRNLRIGAEAVVCYWGSEIGADSFLDQLAALIEADDPALVADIYRSLWKGRAVEVDSPGAFYALTLSGAQGRVIVRDWFVTSVAQVGHHLAEHFADLRIVRNTPPPKGRSLPEQVPLSALLESLSPRGKVDEIPSALASRLVHAALAGGTYPVTLLQRALERTRAEIGQDSWKDLERRDARAALIKAVLNRSRRNRQTTTDWKEITPDMDASNTSPGYLLGRLMAVLERLQQVAMEDVNATIVDRYFGAASASPRAVFTRLLKGAKHHVRSARDEPKIAGTARWLDGQIDEIAAPFDPKTNGFPAYLPLEQQGLFVLGYHHQRHWLWMSKEARAEWQAAAAESRSA